MPEATAATTGGYASVVETTENILCLTPLSAQRRVETPSDIIRMALLALSLSACTPAPRQVMARHPVPVEMAYPCPGESGMPRFVDNQDGFLGVSQLRPTGAKCTFQ